MSEKKGTAAPERAAEGAGYTVDQLKASERYRSQRDLLEALLARDKLYSLQEADDAIEKFMKGMVK